MKFICTVDINLPRNKVVELISNPDVQNEWQEGFLGYELLSGSLNQPGTKTRLRYKQGKGEMVLIETIMENNLPDGISGLYEHKSMVNIMSNRFIPLSDNQTRWEAEVEYTKFNGFMPKLFAFLFPGMFRKQVQKWLDRFKEFAEEREK